MIPTKPQNPSLPASPAEMEIERACEREIASPQEAREQIGLLVAARQGG